jgi:2-amino-4-hydroxy-6-hydroxymethyldihydropteridine diphosphokinase
LPTKDFIALSGLKVPCIIGIFDWERRKKQDVLIDLEFPSDIRKASRRDRIEDTVDYKKIAKTAIAFVSRSRFQLLETLGERLAGLLLEKFGLPEILLSVSKPGAVRGSQNVGVRIHRFVDSDPAGDVYLSLGSNLEARRHLNLALGEIERDFPIVALSHVYETSPVGYRRQAAFWNMALAIRTEEGPERLRKKFALIEKKAGRSRKGHPSGPRTLDVDLILWKDLVQTRKGLRLPHPDIRSKAFVLFPILEINPILKLPGTGNPIIELACAFRDPSQTIRRLPPGTLESFQPRGLRA